MGFDLVRFPQEVDEELVCPICSGVLEEPVQVMARRFAMCVHINLRCCFVTVVICDYYIGRLAYSFVFFTSFTLLRCLHTGFSPNKCARY